MIKYIICYNLFSYYLHSCIFLKVLNCLSIDSTVYLLRQIFILLTMILLIYFCCMYALHACTARIKCQFACILNTCMQMYAHACTFIICMHAYMQICTACMHKTVACMHEVPICMHLACMQSMHDAYMHACMTCMLHACMTCMLHACTSLEGRLQ